MHIVKLKELVMEEWKNFHEYRRIEITSDFRASVRQFGGKDLRRKQSWIQALAYFAAQNINCALTDNQEILDLYFNPEYKFDWHEYSREVFKAFFSIEGRFGSFVRWLQQRGLVQTEIIKEDAHGVFELVSGSSETLQRESRPQLVGAVR